MQRLLNAHKMHAAAMDSASPVGRWGIVISANPATMTVKVTLQPEGVTTDWLPLLSSAVGGGWGLIHVPPVGTQVFCMPDAGDGQSYIVVGATWSAASAPPAGYNQGEIWLVHSSGSSIKLTNDGKLTIADARGSSLALTNDGTATLTATTINLAGSTNISLAGTVNVTGVLKVGGVTVTVP
jgi:phage baseplate assembly protein V